MTKYRVGNHASPQLEEEIPEPRKHPRPAPPPWGHWPAFPTPALLQTLPLKPSNTSVNQTSSSPPVTPNLKLKKDGGGFQRPDGPGTLHVKFTLHFLPQTFALTAKTLIQICSPPLRNSVPPLCAEEIPAPIHDSLVLRPGRYGAHAPSLSCKIGLSGVGNSM